MKRVAVATGLVASHVGVEAVSLRRSGAADALPSYDPTEVLCTLGKDSDNKPKIQGWCQNWLECVETKSQPAGDQSAVMKAWSPAPCKEVCGEWPETTPKEGALLQANSTTSAVAALFGLDGKSGGTPVCVKSCEKFQDSLSKCVAKILFEPGQVAAMGAPDDNKAKADFPAYCKDKDTPCMPDLPIRQQQCMKHKTKQVVHKVEIPEDKKLECKTIEGDMEHCKDCPQLQPLGQSQYATFIGGCMDQLNAYHQATHPDAGSQALAGATGCKVH
eukprot:TRINITY_DN18937_c0_g1_i1.p2 TRINITY_DN18937_c0_g1~~TRINITY_DN18937_c0_g1_i1.p2  ORF type:complete len:274 (-),score=78.73 TRINITY_DN18937_c0_g1_i1:124-945(-)